MRPAFLLLAALALGAGACGRKGPVVPPELIQPDAPTHVVGTSTADGIRLSWTRPDKYTSGRPMKDLGSFVIERSPVDVPSAAFIDVARVELDDQMRFRKERRLEWLDRDVTPGARYVYRVTALTLDGYRSAPSGPLIVRWEPPKPGAG
jgi:hypothetical protein